MHLSYHVSRSLLLFVWLIAFQSDAQKVGAYPCVASDVLVIPSKVLNEKRTVYVHHPKSDSANSDRHYPVLYVMDGESHFDMLSQYVDYLSRWDVDVIPEMIVVGIVNTKYVLRLARKKLKQASTLNKVLFYSDASEGVADKSRNHN